ncbi:hypothetical protein ACTFIU_007355 [Dictyostelium citrinum]
MKFLFFIVLICIFILHINCLNNKPQSISEKKYYFIKPNKNNNNNDNNDIGINKNNSNNNQNGYILNLLNSEVGTIQGQDTFVSNVEIPKKSKLNLSIVTDLLKNQLDGSKDQSEQSLPTQFESKVVVAGEFKDDQSNDFIISDIYHLMELKDDSNNVNPRTIKVKEYYYFMSPSPLICNSMINCSNIIIDKVNSNEPFGFLEKFREPYSKSLGLLDLNWFNSRLVTNDNNYNSIVKGYQYGNNELIISRVYINTLDPIDGCGSKSSSSSSLSLEKQPACRFGKIATFTRDLNRCPVFDKCVKKSPCHLGRPHCDQGYKISSLPFGEKGCLKYYCDPDFLPNTSNKI